jgi:23S rRNA (cytidine1920-2'-O)/16S rRNA (cytidine1409-2'-O)-methyltransferase
LQAGAAKVVAVDVGYGQLAWRLRTDPRVHVLERTNVRSLEASALPAAPSLVTADLSFIGLADVVPTLVTVAAAGADLVLLVKPQFEAPPGAVPPGGVVTDPAVRRAAIERVASAATEAGAGTLAVMPSPIPGPAGNVEFLLHARRGAGRAVAEPGAVAEAGG